MAEHAITTIGRNDAQCDVVNARYINALRLKHRARVETRDLVVVEIGRDVTVSRERAGDVCQRIQPNAKARHALTILRPIVTHRRANDRRSAEQIQRVRDISRTAAKLAAHVFHEKRHIDLVRRARHDVLTKTPLKHTNRVKGHRAANKDAGFKSHVSAFSGQKGILGCVTRVHSLDDQSLPEFVASMRRSELMVRRQTRRH